MKKSFLYILLIYIFAVGCAPKISTQVTMPAKSQEASDIRQVAVFPFEGNYGKKAAVDIENVLANVNVNNKKYFTVVDRQHIQKIMSEQKLQTSGIIDENTAVKLGRLIGAKGVYIGNAEYTDSDQIFTEQRSVCSSSDKNGKCTGYSNYSVTCVKRTAGLNVTPKLIDIATGQVRYSSRLGGSDYISRCSDSSVPLRSTEQLLEGIARGVMDSFRTDVAPYNTTVFIEILDKTDGITDGTGKDNLKYSIDFAKNGRLDRACEIWRKGGELYPRSISYAYNIGICLETEGDINAALNQYIKADKLTNKPEKVINSALLRVRERLENEKILSIQLK